MTDSQILDEYQRAVGRRCDVCDDRMVTHLAQSGRTWFALCQECLVHVLEVEA